jgi:hypothetical protein
MAARLAAGCTPKGVCSLAAISPAALQPFAAICSLAAKQTVVVADNPSGTISQAKKTARSTPQVRIHSRTHPRARKVEDRGCIYPPNPDAE